MATFVWWKLPKKNTEPIWGGLYIHFTYIQKVQQLWDNKVYHANSCFFPCNVSPPLHVFQLVVLPNNSYVVSAPSIRLVELLNWMISPKNWSKNHTKSLKPPPIVLGISSKKVLFYLNHPPTKSNISLIDSSFHPFSRTCGKVAESPCGGFNSHDVFFPLGEMEPFFKCHYTVAVQKSQTTTWDGAKPL